MEIKTPEYWGTDGTLTVFNKYYLDENKRIVNKETKKRLSYKKTIAGYYTCSLIDDNRKKHGIRITRMLVSTFHGKPPTLKYTADHINRDPSDDNICNIRWATPSEQRKNQDRSDNRKCAFYIIKDGIEKTVNDWVNHLIGTKNIFGRSYTKIIISKYAQKNQYGFAYKEYPDLPNEIWKLIPESKTTRGDYWEISNMNRVKFITKFAVNVLSGDRIGLRNGYPNIALGDCHVLAFKTFFPEEYITKTLKEMVLHKNDDKLDFRPSNLRIGTKSENSIDAHTNGCHINTKTARQKCVSYIGGVLEKEHESQADAARYLKCLGYNKASHGEIGLSLATDKIRYGRTWKLV